MVPKKSGSKRIALRQKHKIEKRVRQHNKKQRREDKANPKSASKRDPGIPNLHPFKEQMLKNIEAQKIRAEQEKSRQKEARRKLIERKRKSSLKGMVQDAQERSVEHERKEEMVTTENGVSYSDNSKRAYYKEFKKVVEQADVILEVLDARDPLGCRSEQVEQTILGMGSDKKIVLVLNKIDLVPKDVVQQWLKYLRNLFPTIAFKASTQTQKNNLGQSKVSFEDASVNVLNASESLGTDALVKLLKNYCRSGDVKKSITVGIVGYPNVGKSSLINSLKRSRTCTTGASPGVTKQAQAVHLDKNIKLLDSPGIVFSSDNTDSDVILRNCINIDTLPDPVKPVEVILKRCNHDQLIELYELPEFDTVAEFLTHLAIKRGKIKKGGIADLDAAAHAVLQDWNNGVIPFYTMPPEAAPQGETSIVSGFSKEFNLDDVMAEADTEAFANLADTSRRYVQMTAGSATADMGALMEGEEDEYEDIEMDEDEEEEVAKEDEPAPMEDETPAAEEKNFRLTRTQLNMKVKKEKAVVSARQEFMTPEESMLNPQINKNKRKALKAQKKQQKKQQRTTGSSVTGGPVGEAYDFSAAFSSGANVELDD